jgi:BirA family biotin operon repressor/biotin-[acetyl-CoA-carboxylase] ligase
MISSDFNFQIIKLSDIDSTNSYALELLKENNVVAGTVFLSDFQSKGKGQKGNLWQSESGKNLLFSVLIKPSVMIDNQFLISQCVALGVKKYLDSLAVGKVEVKWPNDILINQRKVAGILIENLIEGKTISNSIIGIGLNMNQTEFEDFDRPAISVKMAIQENLNLEEELKEVLNCLKNVFHEYKMYGKSFIKTHYLEVLYGYNQPVMLEDNQGPFKGKIADISNSGILQVWRNGKLCSYDLKEIKFID